MYCSGEVCEPIKRQEIQKISSTQILFMFGFIVFVLVTIIFFNGYFNEDPSNLWQKLRSF